MTRLGVLTMAIVAIAAIAAAPPAEAQSVFKVPFAFESGAKKFPAGDYTVTRTGETQITFHHVATGKETGVSFTERLTEAEPRTTAPRLVFDEVGNFEPSYTEYFTVYVVAEVWLSRQEGYLVHTTKGAHAHRTIVAGPK